MIPTPADQFGIRLESLLCDGDPCVVVLQNRNAPEEFQDGQQGRPPGAQQGQRWSFWQSFYRKDGMQTANPVNAHHESKRFQK